MIVRVPMSKSGHERLRAELTHLERKERIEVIQSIATAREHGDLKENAEYHAAKERQGHIECRISELKDKLGRAEIIDLAAITCDRAVFGSIIRLMDLNTEAELSYQLLGPEESNVNEGSISIFSPLGKAMIGREEGDEITVQTPGGIRHFEILGISAPER